MERPEAKRMGVAGAGMQGELVHSAAASRRAAGQQVTCACSATLSTPFLKASGLGTQLARHLGG